MGCMYCKNFFLDVVHHLMASAVLVSPYHISLDLNRGTSHWQKYYHTLLIVYYRQQSVSLLPENYQRRLHTRSLLPHFLGCNVGEQPEVSSSLIVQCQEFGEKYLRRYYCVATSRRGWGGAMLVWSGFMVPTKPLNR
jgi:hypothetical protein